MSDKREKAIEFAAQHIYEEKGHRLGKDFIGWDKEPEGVKADWLIDVRATIDAYEAMLTGELPKINLD